MDSPQIIVDWEGVDLWDPAHWRNMCALIVAISLSVACFAVACAALSHILADWWKRR